VWDQRSRPNSKKGKNRYQIAGPTTNEGRLYDLWGKSHRPKFPPTRNRGKGGVAGGKTVLRLKKPWGKKKGGMDEIS